MSNFLIWIEDYKSLKKFLIFYSLVIVFFSISEFLYNIFKHYHFLSIYTTLKFLKNAFDNLLFPKLSFYNIYNKCFNFSLYVLSKVFKNLHTLAYSLPSLKSSSLFKILSKPYFNFLT